MNSQLVNPFEEVTAWLISRDEGIATNIAINVCDHYSLADSHHDCCIEAGIDPTSSHGWLILDLARSILNLPD